MNRMLQAAIVATGVLAGGQAFANCEYLGTLYPVGYTICAEGWLQECTVAGYWSAIGMCHSGDDLQPGVEGEGLPMAGLIAAATGSIAEAPASCATIDG